MTHSFENKDRGGPQNKILEFQAPHNHRCSLGMKKHFSFNGTSLIFKFCPSLGQKMTLQAAQKPKGGPLDEKTIFFKNVLQSF